MPTSVGDYRYSAFISYRHTDLDMKVAKEVHRKLERYHLDRDVQKKAGRRSLAPIFRDQDELPISSALDDDLLDALHNASALIVICSPRLKESQWCMREIDEFLRTHDRGRVFVALAEGEPHDVVPQQLLQRTRSDGTVVEVEPLAADFRPQVKGAARRDEVTRLVAGVLAVPYDSLVKRAQRRRQRMAAALGSMAVAASTAFGIYNASMNARITANYQQALRRRSEYLATEANLLIGEGNTVGAIELALAALPDARDPETLDRPVVPGAVYALQQATNAGMSERFLEYSLTTSEVYASASDLQKVSVSPNERYVVTIDESQTVQLWDAADHELLFGGRDSELGFGAPLYVFARDTGRVVMCYERGLACRESDGRVRWHAAFPGKTVASQACLTEGDQAAVMVTDEVGACALDADSGKVLWAFNYDQYTGPDVDGNSWTALLGECCANDDTFAVALSAGDATGFRRCFVVVIDARTGAAKVFDAPGLYAYRMALLHDNSVVMLLGTNPDESEISDRYRFYSTTYTRTLDFDVRLACLDGEDGAVRWTHDQDIWQVCFDIGFDEVQRESGKPTGMMVCWFGDRILYVDEEDGTITNDLKTAASIVGGRLVEGTDSFAGVLTDGSFFSATEAGTSVQALRLLGSDLYYALVQPSQSLYLIDGNHLMVYRSLAADRTVRSAQVEAYDTSWELATPAGFVMASMPTGRDVLQVELFDAHKLERTWATEFGTDDDLVWYVSDTCAETGQLLVLGMDLAGDMPVMRKLALVDVMKQEVRAEELTSSAEAGLVVPDAAGTAAAAVDELVVGNCACLIDGVVYSQVEDAEGNVGIAAASLEDRSTRCYGVASGFGSASDKSGRRLYLLPSPGGTRLLYQDVKKSGADGSALEVHATAVLDLSTGASEVLDESVASIWEGIIVSRAQAGHAVWSEDGDVLACVTADGVCVYSFDGTDDVRIALDGNRVSGLVVVGERLVGVLTQGTSSQLVSYDLATGEQEALNMLDDGGSPVVGWARVSESHAADGTGDLFFATPEFGYLLDSETLAVCQRYARGCAYDPTTDVVYGRSADGRISARARYTLERLLRRGHTVLGNQTMGEDWLTTHGV